MKIKYRLKDLTANGPNSGNWGQLANFSELSVRKFMLGPRAKKKRTDKTERTTAQDGGKGKEADTNGQRRKHVNKRANNR